MTSALWIAKTGLDAQQMRMSVITNNLANVSTTGFKRGRAQFEDLLYQNVRQVGGQTSQNTTLPSGLSLGASAFFEAASRRNCWYSRPDICSSLSAGTRLRNAEGLPTSTPSANACGAMPTGIAIAASRRN